MSNLEQQQSAAQKMSESMMLHIGEWLAQHRAMEPERPLAWSPLSRDRRANHGQDAWSQGLPAAVSSGVQDGDSGWNNDV